MACPCLHSLKTTKERRSIRRIQERQYVVFKLYGNKIFWKIPNVINGDDEVELTDEEFSDNEDEVAEVFRIDTNIFDFETPMCKGFKEFNYLLQIDPDLLTKDIEGFKTYDEYKDDWIYEWNRDVLWVDEKPWTNTRIWTKPTPVKHYCKPFNYKTGCSEWPTCSWKNDRYCNGGNLPGAYIVENSLHYQDYEWYEALMDSELKEQALRNKAIIEGSISDDESSNDGSHELPVCNIRRFKMIKYSFGQDEEYVVVKEDEYDDLAKTSDDACRAYQEIFRMMDEGWMFWNTERIPCIMIRRIHQTDSTLRPKEISTNNSIELTNLEISFLGGVLNFNAAVQQQLAIHKLNMRESTEQISG
ncbi:hypothetical protein Tco_1088541 [Tanacetum coccineum]